MKRIAPSERIEQQIEQLLNEGLHTEEQPLSQLIRLSARKVVQEALEEEVEAFLGRERYWSLIRRGLLSLVAIMAVIFAILFIRWDLITLLL